MFAFIARQPVLDRDKNLFGYELLFRDGKNNCYPYADKDDALTQRIAKTYQTLCLEDISCNKKSFIHFQSTSLFNGLLSVLDHEIVIVELFADELETSDLLASCKQVKQLGYQISLVNYIFDPQTAECLSYVDLVKVNTQGQDQQQLTDTIQRLADFDVQLIAQNIHTPADFNTCKQLGFDFFQGYFFAKPEQGAKNELPTSKLTLVELIGASSTDTFDIEAINNIVEHDVGLTYILLRFINNPSINKRYKITSLRHALHYMGELELKKFIALLSLANLADEKSTELLHLSLVRAKFCDLVGTQRDKGSNPPTAFLVGLLSSLDALLDQNMLELVKQLPLVDEVKEALCGNENELFYYLVLVRAFESGNWLKVIRIAKMLELDQKTLHSFFNQAILWGNGLRKSISPHFPETKA